MVSIATWFKAGRPQTLALSFALIIVGSAVAAQVGCFRVLTFVLTLLTTLFLQLLSNFCNDYGDYESGADLAGRRGPERMLATGGLTTTDVKRAMWFCGVSAFVAGVLLLFSVSDTLGLEGVLFMFGLGLLSIAAAIAYTVGKHPYGYMGLGDLSVFLFFGLLGVAGSYTLFAGRPSLSVFLPATAIGFFSIGVLNMNNLRDYDSDLRSGKRTLVVRLGTRWSRLYQAALVILGLCIMGCYVALFGTPWQWLFLIAAPRLLLHVRTVLTTQDHDVIAAQLKVMAVNTFLLSLLFAAGTVIDKLI
ncbi:MAG: 1,4-dihydroxy-2-naphthoate octaprenyltransferase [Bacteroidales bacterium]|nr:1,4-dihydroxy-2-naphthoate octaprenyltransferase [Bacteroidales bacterium]